MSLNRHPCSGKSFVIWPPRSKDDHRSPTVAWNVSDVEGQTGRAEGWADRWKAGRRYRSAPRRQLGVYIGASRLLGIRDGGYRGEWIISIVTGPTARAVIVNNCSGTKCKAAAARRGVVNGGHVDRVWLSRCRQNAAVITYYRRYKAAHVLLALWSLEDGPSCFPRDRRWHVSPRSPSIGCIFGCDTFIASDHPKPVLRRVAK